MKNKSAIPNENKQALALEIIKRLKQEYPATDCTLEYDQAWKLLVSVRLAAQCTDARVNLVTPALFAAYPTLEAMAKQLGIWQGYVCPVMDARRGQVYNAVFHMECGKCTRIREDRAVSLQDLGEELQNLSEPVFLVGDGSNLCYNTINCIGNFMLFQFIFIHSTENQQKIPVL